MKSHFNFLINILFPILIMQVWNRFWIEYVSWNCWSMKVAISKNIWLHCGDRMRPLSNTQPLRFFAKIIIIDLAVYYDRNFEILSKNHEAFFHSGSLKYANKSNFKLKTVKNALYLGMFCVVRPSFYCLKMDKLT